MGEAAQAASGAAAFLGVGESFSGRLWVARPSDERAVQALAQRHGIPDLLARSLVARGVGLDDAAAFLDPRLRDLLPNPSLFRDMDRAAERAAAAVLEGQSVAVFGDYDVDGATSSALLLRFFRAVGAAPARLYVPDRLREGYGPNAEALARLAGEGVRLLICVDCGTVAHGPLAVAAEAGMDVVVLDHHAAEPVLPPACAIVNPNRLDDPMAETQGHLAAVGVTFLFLVALNRCLRQAGWYAARPEPDLRLWLDLVALGTVCDVVRLTGLNRAFVAQGLKVMAQGRNAGLAALGQVAGMKGPPDAFAAGFLLGPRVNAGGRVGQADLGARLLATDDPEEAAALAARLQGFNQERRELEDAVLARAEETLDLKDSTPLVFAAGEGWHPGVIGIVAARLKEKYHRPAIVVALDENLGKGSGRSVAPVDLGAAVIAARQAGLLLQGGGHRMAAGLTVARPQLGGLEVFLAERIGRALEAEPLRPTLWIDGLVAAPALTPDFAGRLAALAPFGPGNAEPRFALAGCRVVRARVVGERHVSLVVTQGGARLQAIAFRAMDGALGPALLQAGARPCHLAGCLRVDAWQGQDRVQLRLDDAAPA